MNASFKDQPSTYIPGPRQVAILQHAKLISKAEIEFEESARHPHNRRFTIEEIARTAVNEYATIALDAIGNGREKMAGALITVAAHFATKYNLQPKGLCYASTSTISDPMGTRELSRPVKVIY